MSDSTYTCPSFYPAILSNWLPELGEKALLAWIQLHSWECKESTSDESILIPLSLNKIIKRLKTGKATFYEKILRPLVNFGLVKMQAAPHSKQETHLVVYSYPIATSLEPPAWIDSIQEFSPAYQTQQDTTDDDHLSSFSPQPPQPRKEKDSKPLSEAPVQPLPHSIESAMSKDPRLIERASGIRAAHQQCKNHPHYHEESFKLKMLTCIEYRHDKKHFGSYFKVHSK